MSVERPRLATALAWTISCLALLQPAVPCFAQGSDPGSAPATGQEAGQEAESAFSELESPGEGSLVTEARPRIRDLGVRPGIFSPGAWNAITDVEGVRVGHATLMEGDSARTGVTAILPHGGDLYLQETPAAVFVGNGYGKAAGFLQVEELGYLETPIVLTNTLSVGRAVEAVVAWTLGRRGHEGFGSVNALVGETNDGYLNDIRGMHVNREDVMAAINGATSGPVEEGSVGAGTGTSAFGWKGGIGTSSRKLPDSLGGYTIGALVQTNYNGILTVDGVRVGEALGQFVFSHHVDHGKDGGEPPEEAGDEPVEPGGDGGSCMIVLATDAPLDARNLKRMAQRAVLGLARTGSFLANGSGDFVIAFSTQNLIPLRSTGRTHQRATLFYHRMDPIFLATVEAVEEAVYNSLTKATTVEGRDGHRREALPLAKLRELLEAAGRIPQEP